LSVTFISLGNAFKNFLYHAPVAAIGTLLTAHRAIFMHCSVFCVQFCWAAFQHSVRKQSLILFAINTLHIADIYISTFARISPLDVGYTENEVTISY
jgi:hypothetical protein